LVSFSKLLDDFEAEHEDVVMRIILLTLEGEKQTWYKSLLDAFIYGWDSFQENFTQRWEDKLNNFSLINALIILKRTRMRLSMILMLIFLRLIIRSMLP
jgi:hypothetical protein